MFGKGRPEMQNSVDLDLLCKAAEDRFIHEDASDDRRNQSENERNRRPYTFATPEEAEAARPGKCHQDFSQDFSISLSKHDPNGRAAKVETTHPGRKAGKDRAD